MDNNIKIIIVAIVIIGLIIWFDKRDTFEGAAELNVLNDDSTNTEQHLLDYNPPNELLINDNYHLSEEEKQMLLNSDFPIGLLFPTQPDDKGKHEF